VWLIVRRREGIGIADTGARGGLFGPAASAAAFAGSCCALCATSARAITCNVRVIWTLVIRSLKAMCCAVPAVQIGYSGELDPEIEELSIFDEPGIDLSVPAPGTGDTVSNSAPIEMAPGTHVFWSTMQGEQHGVIEEIAVTDRLLENPAPEMLVEPPHAGRGLKGGGGFIRTHAAPVRVHGRYSDPVYIIVKDDGTRLGKRPHELATIRRANSSLSLGSLGSALA